MRGYNRQRHRHSKVKVASLPRTSSDILTATALILAFIFLLLFPGFAKAETFELSGEINAIIAEDFSIGYEQISYTLTTGDGEIYQLFFNGEAPLEIKTGDYAFVVGEAVNDQTWGSGVLVSEIGVLPVAQSTEATITGSRNALVIRVNFQDQNVSCSENDVSEMMWEGAQNINGLFKEASFDNVRFPKDTNGDSNPDIVSVTLNENLSGNSCDYSGWAQDAGDKAEAAGFDLDDYQHIVLVLPLTNNPCSWAGLGSLGCSSRCYSWTNYCSYPDVLAHELAHNLGLYHARTDTNNDGTTESEYGDTSGIMGYGGVGYRHFNAPHKEEWIPASNIKTVSSSGSQSLALLELDPDEASPSPPSNYQIIKVAKPGESGTYYYFSFRAQEGSYSTNLSSAYSGKINIHWKADSSGYSNFIEAVGSGGSWTDGQVTISSISTSSTGATFTLTAPAGGDDGDSGSVQGYVTKNGTLPRAGYLRKLRISVNDGNGSKCRTGSVDTTTGYYQLSSCPTGSVNFRVKKRRRNRKNRRVFSSGIGLSSGSNAIDVDI